jgi:hypothetical protein
MSVSLITVQDDEWGRGKTAVFAIPLPDRPPVFMCITADYPREDQALVIVDAQPFLMLWRNRPNNTHHALACGTPETWRTDYKFHLAATGLTFPLCCFDQISCWFPRNIT